MATFVMLMLVTAPAATVKVLVIPNPGMVTVPLAPTWLEM